MADPLADKIEEVIDAFHGMSDGPRWSRQRARELLAEVAAVRGAAPQKPEQELRRLVVWAMEQHPGLTAMDNIQQVISRAFLLGTQRAAVRGVERPSFAKLKEAVEFWEYRGVDGKGQRTGAYSWPMDFGSCERIAELALKYIVDLRADPPSLTPPADQERTK